MVGIYAALILFVLFNISLALRWRPRSENDFLIKERQVGRWEMAASTFTILGGGEFVTLTTLTYIFGYASFLYFIGIACGFVVLALIASRIRSDSVRLDLHSLPDFFASKFGPLPAAVCTLLMCLASGALLQIQFIVGSQIIASLTGTSPTVWVVGMAAMVASYLLIAGYRGVLASDTVQIIAMVVSILVICGLLTFSETSRTISPTTVIPTSEATGLVVLGLFAITGGGNVWQRIYSARDDRTARDGLIINSAGWLLFGAMLMWLAYLIQAFLPDADPSSAFVTYITTAMPSNLGPFVSLLILAAVVSTADVEMFVLAVMCNKELSRRRAKPASEAVTRNALICWTVVSATLAITHRNLTDIYFLILYLFAAVGPTAVLRALGRGNTATALLAMIGGSLVIVTLLSQGLMSGWYQFLLLVPALPAVIVKSKEGTTADSRMLHDQELAP